LCPLWPGAAGQNEPVSVGVCDRDTPPLSVWIAGSDPRASRVHQAADHIVVDYSIEVENQQVLLGWRRWCRTVWVTDKLQVPHRTRPSDHEQGMPPVDWVVGPEQDIESKAVNPESLGGTQIMARPGNTQVTCRQRLHCPILAVNASRLNTTIAAVITSNTAPAVMPGIVFLPTVVSGLPEDSVVSVTALVTPDKTDLEAPSAICRCL
jgi:hypothetical protein